MMKPLNLALFYIAWPALYIYNRHTRRERTRILVVCGNEILCTVNWISSGRWALPGGGLHRGEVPVDGAVRELREETGIDVRPEQLDFLRKGPVNEYHLPYTYHCFSLRVAAKPVVKREWYEIMRTRWVGYDRLTGRNAEPDTLAAVQAYFRG